LVKITIRSF